MARVLLSLGWTGARVGMVMDELRLEIILVGRWTEMIRARRRSSSAAPDDELHEVVVEPVPGGAVQVSAQA